MRLVERGFPLVRFIIISALLLLLPRQFSSITLKEREFLSLKEDAVSAYIAQDYQRSLTILSQLRKLSPDLYRINSFPYLEGRVKESLDDLEGALYAYQELLLGPSPLSAYARFRSAKLLTRLERKEEAIGLYNTFRVQHRQSQLLPSAELSLSYLLIEKGDLEEALPILEPLTEKKGRLKCKALFLLGKGYEDAGKVDEAVLSYYRLLETGARDDLALSAVFRLEVLERKKRLSPEKLSLRAEALFINREFSRAIPYYLRLASRYPGEKEGIEAYFRLSTIFRRLKGYEKSLRYNSLALKRSQTDKDKARAYYERGLIYERLEKLSAARSSYKRVFSRYPESSYAPFSLFLLADIERRTGNDQLALDYLKRLERSHPKSSLVIQARLLGARIALSKNWHRSALSWLSGVKTNDNAALSELLFLEGKILELIGEKEKAVSSYLRLCRQLPNEYLAILGEERISFLLSPGERRMKAADLLSSADKPSSNRKKRLEILKEAFFIAPYGSEERRRAEELLLAEFEPLFAALSEEEAIISRELRTAESAAPSYSSLEEVQELFFLGIYDEGSEALSSIRGNQASFYYFLSRAYLKGGNIRSSIAYAERVVSQLPEEIPFSLFPEELKELLYPVPPFFPVIKKYAGERELDPLFICALIREESRFDPGAKSRASARGLMQLIPETARREGRKLGYQRVNPSDLYRPEVSIDIGTAHFIGLVRDFDGLLLPALAAYNAGKEAARRWLSLAPSPDPDLFLFEIGYRETRRYVPMVARSYLRYYQLLKPEELSTALTELKRINRAGDR
jgi:soluble lytic murein transglycosylase-like protein/predicted Zn-dependent protease